MGNMVKTRVEEEDVSDSELLDIQLRFRSGVEYLPELRKHMPNGVSLLVDGSIITVKTPSHLNVPDYTIDIGAQEFFKWVVNHASWGVPREYTTTRSAEYDEVDLETLDPKKRLRLKDEEFYVLTILVAELFQKDYYRDNPKLKEKP